MSSNTIIPWTEKYRPKTLETYIFPEDFTEEQINYIKASYENKFLNQNLLLFGKGGTGKTTLAKILLNRISPNPKDYRIIKGRTISDIDELKEWIPRKPYKSKQKLVIIEEADRISDKAYAELKSIIEESNSIHKTYFILLTNRLDKISARDEALIQRFTILKFTRIPKDKAFEFSKYILTNENIKFDENHLKEFISYAYNNYWSLRNIIHTLQISSITGTFNFQIPKDNQYTVYTSGTEINSILANNIKAFIDNLYLIDDSQIINDIMFTTDINSLLIKYKNYPAVTNLVNMYNEIKKLLLENYKLINYNAVFNTLMDLIPNPLIQKILKKYETDINISRDKIITILSMLYEFVNLRYELINLSNKGILSTILKTLENLTNNKNGGGII